MGAQREATCLRDLNDKLEHQVTMCFLHACICYMTVIYARNLTVFFFSVKVILAVSL